jgi:hypothetical protein
MGEGGIRVMTQLIGNIHAYQTGEWPKDFTEVTLVDLKKKPKLQNAATVKHDQPHRTYSQDSSKDMKEDKIKTENVVGDLFGFRRGKRKKERNWDAENNVRTKFGHRFRIVCLLQRLGEDI